MWRMGRDIQTVACRNDSVAKQHKHQCRVWPITSARRFNDDWTRPVHLPATLQQYHGDYLLNHVKLKHLPDDTGALSTKIANMAANQFVGKALVFPTIDDANAYRRALHGNVGIMYYLDGMGKVESSGVFGGQNSGAPALRPGTVSFSKPKPATVVDAERLVYWHQRLRELVDVRDNCDVERANAKRACNTPEFRADEAELTALQQKLQQADRELQQTQGTPDRSRPGHTSAASRPRSASGDDGFQSSGGGGPAAKRARHGQIR
jgi:hypothetical protein